MTTDNSDNANLGKDSSNDTENEFKNWKQKLAEAEADEKRAETQRRKHVVITMLCFSGGLFISAVCFAFFALYFITAEKPKADWHILFVVTSLLVPPSLLCFAIIRGVFKTEKDRGAETPAGDVIAQFKELIEPLKGLIEVISPKN